ncbi:PTS sugar transporter subunit IIA [uncultured Brevundimonas sp.]|uniref:PTS sugar transporter subunit IIA n=1 Tax=uncultured Brevundimonas sp. TaxID=213418 RepID=UPI002633C740|nr:PTS sugar transporter subunit IIA [uncultured Brevundimonas sp.]
MDIADLLSPEGVVLRGAMSSKRQALGAVAEVAANAFKLDSAKVLEALLEREALGSTGLGYGVAVPHARVEGLDRVCGVFVRLEQPVAYEALDDRPVDLLFGLFAPLTAGADHLRALAVVSRAMRSPELRERLRQAQTVDGVQALFVQTGSAAAA